MKRNYIHSITFLNILLIGLNLVQAQDQGDTHSGKGQSVVAASAIEPVIGNPEYRFDSTISRKVLENYLDRSISEDKSELLVIACNGWSLEMARATNIDPAPDEIEDFHH